MLPCCNDDSLFRLLLLYSTCNCQQWTIHPCQGLAQCLSSDKVPSQRIHLKNCNFVLKICISVRVTIAKKYNVFVVLKSVGECGSEVEFQKPVVLPDIVFEVGYVTASSMPSHSLVLGFFFAV